MDSIAELTKVTKLIILNWSASYSYSTDPDPANDYQGSGDALVQNLALDKVPGQLQFTLNTAVFSIKEIQKNFDIIFKGQATDQNTVRWTPSVAPNASVTIKKHSGIVKSVSGSLTTSVSEIAPPQLTDNIFATVSLQSNINQQFTFKIDITDYEGITPTVTINFNTTKFNALAGILSDITLSIFPNPSDVAPPLRCFVEGQMHSFQAVMTGVPDNSSLVYNWTVTPGGLGQSQTPPGNNQQKCVILLTNDGTLTFSTDGKLTVAVEVELTLKGQLQSFNSKQEYLVISKAKAGWLLRLLELESELNPILSPILHYNGPGPDPGPEKVLRQLGSKEFLLSARDFGTYLSRTSGVFLNEIEHPK